VGLRLPPRRRAFQSFLSRCSAFGTGRSDLYALFPQELKLVHALPALFVAGLSVLILLNLINWGTLGKIPVLPLLCCIGNIVLLIYTFLLFLHAWSSIKSIRVAGLGVVAAYTQLIAYGLGFISNYIQRVVWKK